MEIDLLTALIVQDNVELVGLLKSRKQFLVRFGAKLEESKQVSIREDQCSL